MEGCEYKSGSGTDKLRFSYQVQPGDLDADGMLIGAKGEQGLGENKIKALNHDVNALHTYREMLTEFNVDGNIYVKEVGIASTTADGETYRYGETIDVDVTFSVPVRALHNPFIGLWLDGTGRSESRVARYTEGSGTRTLRFSYEVMPGDLDSDGLFIGALGENGMGTGIAMALDHDWVADHSFDGREFPSHKVNGNIKVTGVNIVSSPASGDTYRFGESIEVDVTFSAPVRAVDTPHVSLWFDGTGEALWRGARYQSGSGTETLRFAYEVQAGDRDTDGILIGGIDYQGLGEGKVLALNHDLEANHSHGEQFLEGHKVNGQPYVKAVEITSSPALGGDIYGQGEAVEITVYFDQELEKEGEVKLGLDIYYPEDEPTFAAYVSGDGSDAFVFSYEVGEDDYDDDGISVSASSGNSGFAGTGTIRAAGTGVELDPTQPGLENAEGHRINGGSLFHDRSGPRIKSINIVSQPKDGETYTAGDWIGVEVIFNEHVTVLGIPKVELDIESGVRMARYAREFGTRSLPSNDNPTRTLILGYQVQEGDYDDDGIAIGATCSAWNAGKCGTR